MLRRATALVMVAAVAASCGGDSPADPALPGLAIVTTGLAPATMDVPYDETLAASGGDGVYSWSVTAGLLPTGLALASTGSLTGAPSGTGTTFTVAVSSGDGQTVTRELAVDVIMTWDLTDEWSDATNPFGPWTLLEAAAQPFAASQPDYWANATNQAAWAAEVFPQTAHVPMWMKVTVDDVNLDSMASSGTVVAHTAELARTGSNLTAVTWTSPVTGAASLEGGAWIRQQFDRPQLWEIYLNGALVTGGRLAQGDGFTEADPAAWSTGSAGASATDFDIVVGDVIELRLSREASGPAYSGDMVGVDLAVIVQTQAGA